ncbi:4-coumarate--CoA ligase-like 9 [Striga hermonthica]|uniref:4-coumarate--CoA ligase-like 9 n=1 Tax=Striga hermonthica TaxID=68872 RepID=A0A9N7N5B6_STRHE|nr:4-coumarate--CoA ligase-like 9 [Striga hermonthica]
MDNADPSSGELRSGFCPKTNTFYSLRPPVHLPPEKAPLSAADYAFSLHSATSACLDAAALIDAATGNRISYSQFRLRVEALSVSLRSEAGLSPNDVAFVLSPNSTCVPILYFALLSIGVVISPSNPISTTAEIARQLKISMPTVAFATSATSEKLAAHRLRTILIDSADFARMMSRGAASETSGVRVRQNDVAAILFSSGTTGQVKGVELTHRNFIAVTANYFYQRLEKSSPSVGLPTVPLFHVFGFHYLLKSVALGETVVVMGRFDLGKMLRAVEEHKVTLLAVAPPVVAGMVKSDLTRKFDLQSLEAVGSGAAPLGLDLIEAFKKKFPKVSLYQVCQ